MRLQLLPWALLQLLPSLLQMPAAGASLSNEARTRFWAPDMLP